MTVRRCRWRRWRSRPPRLRLADRAGTYLARTKRGRDFRCCNARASPLCSAYVRVRTSRPSFVRYARPAGWGVAVVGD